ncbi:hypothetical protein [Candidatus Entotheonella palauensis]|uniref:Uncharacterized protein n=1 Tax=Candidatus Entotheonella gemina TaxID=1429439 RepID=W4M3J0_9BACT|nr:hypothetical protein [Candidatus Entotheonella palauensis]ETX04207.1 MAG: hypothetical protein ETSY2_30100 [Candidatus Entotheonella gemina]
MQSQSPRPAPIPENHPLRRLFHAMTEASFEQVGMPDMELMIYVTGVLIDFVHVDNLYRIRDAQGRRLEYLFELQQESEQGDAVHAREAQKHLGDYALFMVGMFPEHLQRRRRAVSPAYYVTQGKTAYATVSAMDGLRPSAALFRKLAEHFETCVQALNHGKTYFQDSFYQYVMRQMA